MRSWVKAGGSRYKFLSGYIGGLMTLSISGFLSAQPVDIIDLHFNTASGMPRAPYSEGTRVTVTGIVTVGTGVYGENFEIYVQDATGGVCAFAFDEATTVELGDSVSVTGNIHSYNGLIEIYGYSSEPLEILVHSSGHVVPEPLVVTCHEVANSFRPDGSESNEGRLVRINSVTYVQENQYGGTLYDSTGSCLLFIDRDTNILHPTGTFDVIGILKQYDQTSPFTSGYEISPRFSSDIISHFGPRFLSEPAETEIGSTSVTIAWQTDTPASSVVEYGRTDGYELGRVGDSTLVSSHAITLQNLSPATVYHCRALSTDQTGTNRSHDLIFCSGSSPESTGGIAVYFNKSVDTTYARETSAQGHMDLAQRLIGRINTAAHSIDFCFYNLTDEDVAQTLKNAKQRGVSVRVICDHDNRMGSLSQVPSLETAGIQVIDNTYGDNAGQGYMHNKFVVFDHRDTSSAADDWVWTGSYNATFSGNYYNAENAMVVQDEALAECYTIEFNEMWGSDGEVPNPNMSRFGSRKWNNTPHRFSINGVWLEQYMSPSDGTTSKIIDVVETADYSAYFCILSFTRDDIAGALRDRWYNVQGFKLKGVFDNSTAAGGFSQYSSMSGAGTDPWSPPADVWLSQETRLLHHKYMLVDAFEEDSDPTVVTGSHNWSSSAENENDENTVIIHDADIANQYLQEFAERYRVAGGSDDLRTGVEWFGDEQGGGVPAGFQLSSFYPNPFNGEAHASFELSAAIGRSQTNTRRATVIVYSLLGRKVRTLLEDIAQPGRQTIRWNGTDEQGQPVVSGVYLCVLAIGDQRCVQKLTLLK